MSFSLKPFTNLNLIKLIIIADEKINKMLRKIYEREMKHFSVACGVSSRQRNNCFAVTAAATKVSVHVCLINHANILYLNIP